MFVVQVTSSLSRLAGGLFESVRHLAKWIDGTSGVRIEVLGPEDTWTGADRKEWSPLRVSTYTVFGPRRFSFGPGLDALLRGRNPDVIHLHGLWQYSSVAVFRRTRRDRCLCIVSPRGMLEPWALAQSAPKKRLGGWLFQRACLNNARCICVTSRMEAESVRQFGLRNPIAVVPNGVELFCTGNAPKRTSARRRALFLSRIHPKKGLRFLVEAWKQVARVGWELAICGPNEGRHLEEIQELVKASGLEREILFIGEAWGSSRDLAYKESELFILPSMSENFGLAIAEALANGLPVITTKATPWEELSLYRCGWWVDVGTEALVRALQEALTKSEEELRGMGMRGRRLVEEKYAWGPIARQMIEVYRWTLGLRDAPECVLFD